MEDLVTRYIPHAPKFGLFVRPDIPSELVGNAIEDYAKDVPESDVIALLDETYRKDGKDGVVFTAQYLVFQNYDFERPRKIWYKDIVQCVEKRKWMSTELHLDVNSGSATISEAIKFNYNRKACEYVYRFIVEVMRLVDARAGSRTLSTNWPSVRLALRRLLDDGEITRADYDRLMTHVG